MYTTQGKKEIRYLDALQYISAQKLSGMFARSSASGHIKEREALKPPGAVLTLSVLSAASDGEEAERVADDS